MDIYTKFRKQLPKLEDQDRELEEVERLTRSILSTAFMEGCEVYSESDSDSDLLHTSFLEPLLAQNWDLGLG